MYTYQAKVRSVYDGDTFRADVDLGFNVWLNDIPFRLSRINAPELIKADPRGRVARDYLTGRMPLGSEVIIRTYKDSQEKYGRYLADIYVDGVCLNDELVKYGFALYWDGNGERPI